MIKKIITYLLIISVIVPTLSALPSSLIVNKIYAQTSNYTNQGSYETFTSTYKNSNGSSVTRTEVKNNDGSGTVTEEYKDAGGVAHRRMGNYENDASYDSISWSETQGSGGDFQKEVSADTAKSESDYNSGIDKAIANSHNGETYNPCNLFWKGSMGECISYITAWVMYFPFRVTNYITAMAGSLFNSSIGFSLSSQSFPTGNGSMIATGWTITRDLVNLFFIFILLYIAISTILQYGSFGKDVLVKLIIAAVLINFSLMITKVIIDSSHILAWEFYNKIDVTNEKKAGDGTQFADIKDEMKIKGFETKNLANVFLAGFNPQKLIIPSTDSTGNPETLLNKVNSNGGNIKATWFQLILIMTLATVLNLVAAFILFAGAILFVIRVVVLWFVLILSPLAFAGMVVPSFQKYSSQWWDKLISQAFFAPAFLFLFYLVTELINSGFLKSVISAANNTATGKVLFLETGSTIVVFFHFLIVGVLMVGCLWIAQQMGAYGAEGFMKSFNKGKDWAQGKVKSMAIGGAKYTAGYAGEYTRRGAGILGEKVATGEGKITKALRWIPGMTKLGADLSAKNKAKIDEIQKGYEKYSDKELENMMPTIAPRSFTRAALVQELAKRKNLRGVPKETIGKAEKTLESYGAKTKDIKNLQWQHAPKIDIITPAAVTERENAIKGVYDAVNNKWTVPKLNASVIEDVDIEKYFDKPVGGVGHNPVTAAANASVRKAMYETFHGGHIQNFFKRNDARDMSDRFFKNMETDFANSRPGVARDINELIAWLEQPAYGIENRQLGAWARSRAGQQLLNSYGWT